MATASSYQAGISERAEISEMNGDGRVRRYENGVYWQAARLDERLALLRIRSEPNLPNQVGALSDRSRF